MPRRTLPARHATKKPASVLSATCFEVPASPDSSQNSAATAGRASSANSHVTTHMSGRVFLGAARLEQRSLRRSIRCPAPGQDDQFAANGESSLITVVSCGPGKKSRAAQDMLASEATRLRNVLGNPRCDNPIFKQSSFTALGGSFTDLSRAPLVLECSQHPALARPSSGNKGSTGNKDTRQHACTRCT